MRSQHDRGRRHARRAEEADQPRLSWAGRDWEPAARLTERMWEGMRVPPLLHHESSLQGGLDAAAVGRLVLGDALDVARALACEGLAGAVDLVYVDPPFASQAAYVHEARLDGPADGRIARAVAYDDRWDEAGGA